LALLLFSIVPAIGPDGLVISRIDFKFLLIAFPIVILAQHFLGRWLMRGMRPRPSLAGMVTYPNTTTLNGDKRPVAQPRRAEQRLQSRDALKWLRIQSRLVQRLKGASSAVIGDPWRSHGVPSSDFSRA
jgi:hypothetical protein